MKNIHSSGLTLLISGSWAYRYFWLFSLFPLSKIYKVNVNYLYTKKAIKMKSEGMLLSYWMCSFEESKEAPLRVPGAVSRSGTIPSHQVAVLLAEATLLALSTRHTPELAS